MPLCGEALIVINGLITTYSLIGIFSKLASAPLILSYAPAVRLRIDFPLSVEHQSK